MAREVPDRLNSAVLSAADIWNRTCLVGDGSIFGSSTLWTSDNVAQVYSAFVEHPDFGMDDFMTKLKGQMFGVPVAAQQLMAEMLWALLLFPSNIKAKTKKLQIRAGWALSGHTLSENHPLLSEDVLQGIGSGGPGFNNYRPSELTYLIEIVKNLKSLEPLRRANVLNDYDTFLDWIATVPQEGSRQFRHMLRYFTFPDRVERMSSNQDRIKILNSYQVASVSTLRNWSDRQLDDALYQLRSVLQSRYPGEILDFYCPPLVNTWGHDRIVRTELGPIPVVVPTDDDDQDYTANQPSIEPLQFRQSIQIQAKLAEIGTIMGCKVWIPRGDRSRVMALVAEQFHPTFLDDLPLNYDDVTLDTIEQIDVIWLRGRSIVRAFEVEHTTAVYSGLLRMADLLALQPNMDIRLHIVAPEERREKVFREMLRPVFTLLGRGPLVNSCTFLSYDSVLAIREIEHLVYMNERLLEEYEEKGAV